MFVRMLLPIARVCAAVTVPLFLIAGCAAPEKSITFVEPEASAKAYAALVLSGVRNSTGTELSKELIDRTTTHLSQKLVEHGFVVQDEVDVEETQDYLILDSELVRYEGGDVMGRWIGFGAGAASCSLYINLIDGRSGKDVGDVVSTQTLESGGLFTVGAEDYIVDWCAEAAADGVAKELTPQNSEN
jgi:hypothetical protein